MTTHLKNGEVVSEWCEQGLTYGRLFQFSVLFPKAVKEISHVLMCVLSHLYLLQILSQPCGDYINGCYHTTVQY